MIEKFRKGIVFVLCIIVVSFVSCAQGHVCVFDKEILTEEFLKSNATCQARAEYYYSCECGKKGDLTFQYGKRLGHDFTAERPEEKYIKKPANCQEQAIYYKSCTMCGTSGGYGTFSYGGFGACDFSQEVADGKYLYSEATHTESASYYKSCVCGQRGTETFLYGTPLKVYTEEEKIPYTPTSITVSLYDSENSVYGFTCNTESEPLRPVLQIQKTSTFDETMDYMEYPMSVNAASSYNKDDTLFMYYILKTEVALESGGEYSYRIYDKYVDVGSTAATIFARDTKSDSFAFAHISDTQEHPDKFGNILNSIVSTTDFVLHTGDIVEYSKYEQEWK